jgi:hypothetical protein
MQRCAHSSVLSQLAYAGHDDNRHDGGKRGAGLA